MVKLRQALDDDSDAPRFIETLPKRGYRFLMPVEVSASGVAGDDAISGKDTAVGDIGIGSIASGKEVPLTTADASAVRRTGWLRRIISWPSRSLAAVACIGMILWLMPIRWRGVDACNFPYADSIAGSSATGKSIW